jgi:hypothetical protein
LTPPEAPADWNDFTDVMLLHTIAGAVIELADMDSLASMSLPYPKEAQRALDRMILMCLQRGISHMPLSVPDLINWCATRPIEDWPLQLPDDAFCPDDFLIDPEARVPTRLCHEWWFKKADAATKQFDREVIHVALKLCRQAGLPESYTAFRLLLVDRPVLTIAERFELDTDLYLEPVRELLRTCYVQAPVSYLRDGAYTTCRRCLTLLTPLPGGTWWCERDACRLKGPAQPGRSLVVADVGDPYHLQRPLRLFVTGPGRAETDLKRRLLELGDPAGQLHVALWPGFDTYDLRVTFPDGHVWAIDVKDWKHPALLGRAAKTIRPEPPYDQSCWVVPRAQADAHGSYLSTFYRNRPRHAAALPLLTDDQLVARAADRLAGKPDVHLNTGRTAGPDGDRDA